MLLHYGRILLAQADDRAVGRRGGLHVAVRVGPAQRFVIQLIELHAAGRSAPETADQMLQPGRLDRRLVGDVIGQDIAVEQLRAVGGDAVAAGVAIGEYVRVGGLLRPVCLHRETARPGGAAVDIRDDRNGQKRGALGRLVGQNQRIRPATGRGIGVAVAAHEIPVKPGVTAIHLPIIARGAIAAPAQDAEMGGLLKRPCYAVFRHAVDVGADRVLGGLGVYGDSGAGDLRMCGRGQCRGEKEV